MAPRKKKNPAAVAMARLSNQARTPEQRSALARRAVQTRWRKVKPNAVPQPPRYWCLFGLDERNLPLVLFASQDREEVIQRARTEFRDQGMFIDFVDYNPMSFTIVPEFQPDHNAQLKALHVALTSNESEAGGL